MSIRRIALFQAQSGIDPPANARKLVEAVSKSAEGGAAMLFTPEMSGMLDRDRERALGKAKSEGDDGVLAEVREAAAKHGVWVHLGSLALRGDGGKLVNRGFVIDNRGEIRARYDKIHLFDVDLPTGESWRESAMYEAGTSAVIVPDTPVGKLGLTICYDLRFPELFQRLSEAGADVISVPEEPGVAPRFVKLVTRVRVKLSQCRETRNRVEYEPRVDVVGRKADGQQVTL